MHRLSSLWILVACLLFPSTDALLAAEERQWFQVRIYHLESEAAEALFDRTFAEAVVPALQRQGVKHLGVFKPVSLEKDQGKALPRQRYVISALDAPDQLVGISEGLRGDQGFLEKAGEYLTVAKKDAVYSRMEASLLYAFEGMPTWEVPEKQGEAPRLFELRVYESYSELKGKRKVEMFNQGEIDVFRKVGLNCLFFGEAVVAKNLPQLTYLAVYNDEAHRKEVWDKFLKHPDWEALKGQERYRDTVSKIISQHLQALEYSPIQ
jgi:hypothetical protein